MAQIEGLHTNTQADLLGDDYVRRGRQIWWTVYSLDRRIATAMGVPHSLLEEDITAPLPGSESTSINLLGQTLHIRICQLLGKVIRSTFLSCSEDVGADHSNSCVQHRWYPQQDLLHHISGGPERYRRPS